MRVALLLAAAGSLMVANAAAAAGRPPDRLRFAAPVTAIPAPLGAQQADTGEPRLVVLPDGRVLLAAQFEQWNCATGRPSSTPAMCVWRSDDDGRTFRISGGDPQAGDDADFAVAADGAVLESAMANDGVGTGVGGTTVMRSGDGGRTWSESDLANMTVLNDRPFVVTAGNAVLLTFTAIPGNVEVVRSTDGGRTFGVPVPVTPVPPPGVIDENDGPAYDSVHRQVLLPYASSSAPECVAQTGASGCLDTLSLASSGDDGRTWRRETVAHFPGRGLTCVANVAVDAHGRRYVVFATAAGFSPAQSIADRAFHVYLTRSAGPGRPWSEPRRLDVARGSSLLPWVIAYGDAHLALAYYHSSAPDAGSVARPWDVVAGRSSDGGMHWSSAVVSRHAYTGSGSSHQTVIWDLLGVARDRRGRLLVAWTDDLGHPGGPTVIRVARSRDPV